MMKKLFLILIISSAPLTFSAQSAADPLVTAKDQLVHFYNNSQYDSIFMMYSAKMKEFLPQEKNQFFFSGFKAQRGAVKNSQLERKKNSRVANFVTDFNSGSTFMMTLSLNEELQISGLYFKPYQKSTLPTMERNVTKLMLPFKEEWTVVWGGDTVEQNYHVESLAQKNAFDLVIKDDAGNSFKGDQLQNESYYAFGKELIAPADAKVVLMVDGVPDNIPGEMNPVYVPGNTVILKTDKEEYLFFAHFKKHSIVVNEGQQVKQGELLGLVGNSGNSSEPHIHFHIMNTDDMTKATGIKAYFDEIMVNNEIQIDYSPVQSERIKNK